MSLCCFVVNDLSFSKLSMWGDASFSKTAAFYCTGSRRGENSDLMIIHYAPPCCSAGSLKKKPTLWMPIVTGLCCHSGYVTSLHDAGAWPTTTGLSQRAFESGRLSALLISPGWENLRDYLWAGSVWLPSSPPTLVLLELLCWGVSMCSE